MRPGLRLQKAAERLIEIGGSAIPYKRGASTITITGRLGILRTQQRFEWFTSTETTGWDAPAYVLMIVGDFQPFSSEPTTLDFVLLDNYSGTGVPYDVKRWDKQRIDGICIRTLIFLEKR